MPQHYSDPSRESKPHALPDLEVWSSTVWEIECSRGCGTFEVSEGRATAVRPDCICPSCEHNSGIGTETDRAGWFYWFCLPGCLPDSEESGPFNSEADALADARDGLEY